MKHCPYCDLPVIGWTADHIAHSPECMNAQLSEVIEPPERPLP